MARTGLPSAQVPRFDERTEIVHDASVYVGFAVEAAILPSHPKPPVIGQPHAELAAPVAHPVAAHAVYEPNRGIHVTPSSAMKPAAVPFQARTQRHIPQFFRGRRYEIPMREHQIQERLKIDTRE